MKRSDITPELLRERIDYNPETGVLKWLPREETNHHRVRWNAMYAGKPALASRHKDGYLHGHIGDNLFLAHRVAFAHYYGFWPMGQLDHINGSRDDNRIVNMRDVAHLDNCRNRKTNPRSQTGCSGVTLHRPGVWRAIIGSNYKKVHLGLYDSFEGAVAARKQAEADYGFHANHNR